MVNNPGSTLTWLHLSDLHMRAKERDSIRRVLDALWQDLRSQIQQVGRPLDFIVFSGDVAYSGQKEEYDLAERDFFDPLLKTARVSPDRVYLVPGNHDVDRTTFDSIDIKSLQSRLSASVDPDEAMEFVQRRLIPGVMPAYAEFARQYRGSQPANPSEPPPPHHYFRQINLTGTTAGPLIAVLGLNSAWFSGLVGPPAPPASDRGRIRMISERQLTSLLGLASGASLVLAVLHHPLDWIAEEDHSWINSLLSRRCDLILHGHWHDRREYHLEAYGANRFISIPSGAVFGHASHRRGYNIVTVDLDTGSARLFARRYNDSTKSWEADVSSTGRTDGSIEFTLRTRQPPPQPITVNSSCLSDAPSSIDLLGFAVYARALADFIESEQTEKPLTIGIDAPWGMGKTTLMCLIEKILSRQAPGAECKPDREQKGRHDNALITAWFDAWKYDQQESLWAALALTVLDQVRKQLCLVQKAELWRVMNLDRSAWRALVRDSLKLLFIIVYAGVVISVLLWLVGSTTLGSTITTIWTDKPEAFLGVAGIVSLAVTFVKDSYRYLTKPFDLGISRYLRRTPRDYQERVGFLSRFRHDFQRLVSGVTNRTKSPLVVFIDDLDRCAPPKPAEVLEALNTLLSTKHCVFVLGMDSRAVACSMEAKHKDLAERLNESADPGGLTLGQRFLEKIVQVTFRIPASDEDTMTSFIGALLGEAEGQPSPEPPPDEVGLASDLMQSKMAEGRTVDEAHDSVRDANPEISAAALRRAREDIYASTFDESPEVRQAIRDAWPYLGYNPRKVKRFINVFRLRALIANRLGLLASGEIRLKELATEVIIETRWPHAIEAIATDATVINRLQEAYRAKADLKNAQEASEAASVAAHETRLDAFLSDPLIKRLVDAQDLLQLLDGVDMDMLRRCIRLS